MKKIKELRLPKMQTLVLLLLFPVFIFAADPPDIPEGWSSNFIYANGIRIHYYHAVPKPDKPKIIMVHGITDNGLCWADLSLQLQDSYDIYMLDARGHGLSDPFTDQNDSNTLIKDVVSFAKAMQIENPILIGHSMGAATVMRLGAEYPDLAKAILMLDPRLPQKEEGKKVTDNRNSNRPPPQRTKKTDPLAFSMMGSPESLAKQNNYSYNDLVAKGTRENPKWSETDVKYWALSKKQYHGAYSDVGWQAMSGTMQTGNALATIPVPALILKADTKPDVRKEHQEVVADMPRVKLVHIDGGRHNLHHDELNLTLTEIRNFLNALD